MIDRDTIRAISDKEMDRKDFLKYSGVALFALVGLRTIVDILLHYDSQKTSSASKSKTSRGFGGGKYGA